MCIRLGHESTYPCLQVVFHLLYLCIRTTKMHGSRLCNCTLGSFTTTLHDGAATTSYRSSLHSFSSKSSFWSLILDPSCCSFFLFLFATGSVVCGSDLAALSDGAACIRRREDSISRLNFVIACIFRHSFVSFYQRNALSR